MNDPALSSSRRRGRKAYFAASLIGQAAALLRFVLLARLLGPEQLGFAAMLILTSQFFESVSDTGGDRFLIQDPEGDAPIMQRFVQLVTAGRGVCIAVALAVTAMPLAVLYKAPELAPALVALAIAPLIAGFANLDVRRLQRHGDFRQESAMIIVGETAALVGTVWAALLVRDHTAVIYGLVARAVAMVIVSHISAERRYGWGYARDESLRFTKFAVPLALNGLLLFAGSQGDRLLIGSTVGPLALGHYSAVLLLVYYPVSAISKFVGGVHMPELAAARSDAASFDTNAQRLAGRSLLLAMMIAGAFALVGPFVTPLLYGQAFAQGAGIFAFLGCLQAARFLRVWPTTLAIAVGRSTIVVANNMARMIGVLVALIAGWLVHGLEAIVAGFFIGEMAALLVALVMLSRASTITLGPELRRAFGFFVMSVALVASAWAVEARHLAMAAVAGAAAAATLGLVSRQERVVILEFWRQVQRRIPALR